MTTSAVDGAAHSAIPELPQEIWLIIVQELTKQRDFTSLFTLAQVDRMRASLALPLLYSIHELSPASTGDTAIVDTKKWALLWRSILASSVGATQHPYCLAIKSLSLGNLHSLLEDLARDQYKDIRSWFFSPPLEKLHILSEPRASGRTIFTRQRRTLMNIEHIIIEAANLITDFVRRAATAERKAVALTSLEGYHLPTTLLPGWISRLSRLTSLTIRDGSVLNDDVSQAIRENCPQFRELVCHYCVGPDVDEDLSGFVNGLSPNTLESFTIMSANRVSRLTYEALNHHSSSLKTLSLYVEDFPVIHLPHLSGCTNLVNLTLDVSSTLRDPNWAQDHPGVVEEIAAWLEQCTALKKLAINLPATPYILGEALKASGMRLRELEVTIRTSDDDTTSFSAALATQTDLRSFVFRSVDGGFGGSAFIDAICRCTSLRKLDLVTQMLKRAEFYKLASAMSEVEEFSFDLEEDEVLKDEGVRALAQMRQLKMLSINATTELTNKGLLAFFDELDSPSASHRGISIHVMRQLGTAKFSRTVEERLNKALDKKFGGRIDITYDADPDELHESDFSD